MNPVINNVVHTPSYFSKVLAQLLFLTMVLGYDHKVQQGMIRATETAADSKTNYNFKFQEQFASGADNADQMLKKNDLFIICGVGFGVNIDTEAKWHYSPQNVSGATAAEKLGLSRIQNGTLDLVAGSDRQILKNYPLEYTIYSAEAQPNDGELRKNIVPIYNAWACSGENPLQGNVVTKGTPVEAIVGATTTSLGLELHGVLIRDAAKDFDFTSAMTFERFTQSVMNSPKFQAALQA